MGRTPHQLGNIEYDAQHAFFLQFVRSGDRRSLETVLKIADHYNAYRLTQQDGRPDPRLAEHLRKGTAPAIQTMSGTGKSFSQSIRVTPRFMGVLAELADEP